MDTSRLLLLVYMVITTSECSETAEPGCDLDTIPYNVHEGEAFKCVHDNLDPNVPDEEITWFNNNQTEITADENETVHYHGGSLFFLNLLPEDSGLYSARHNTSAGKCRNYKIRINVHKKFVYQPIVNSDIDKKVTCPNHVRRTCATLIGELTWNKDNKTLHGQNEKTLWVANANKTDEGIYTCVCTWTHNGKKYNTSGHRSLTVQGDKVSYRKLEIISPTNEEQLADEGVGIKLYCKVYCGINMKRDCNASWEANGVSVDRIEGYSQVVIKEPSINTIFTAVLTIEKVSAKDFAAEFKCLGIGSYEKLHANLILKRRESIIPLVTSGVCVLSLCVFAAVLIKCFAIDLALFFRPFLPKSSYKKDSRVYDAYVVYQTQSMDKVTEDSLSQFITKTLPSVLEGKCGYRLFIHGRDDIPGEDRLELVEDRMQQSRRLMVLLTPGSGPESKEETLTPPRDSLIGGFDCQVGLHHALLQREMSVILIQLGATGPQGYSHLPAGLQHLIQNSAPIRWPEGSRGAAASNSRFWKRVRYLMPAIPARKHPPSAII
ncbi:interleukin-1 receptor-like 1 [Gymnodraco acuticeps]|uniref:Interleukin-1 receptor-like 1 n=1 Tax=Gymnodraco acuticeps TaxID=8218 RepID=A0A6P8T6Y6_GYMAC|nr:interleukin-1 receptor-like 1 [Gymnodraco acuticeps]XP_034059488.1 interleukin-1 receptor-like 1 [Gymnodraco acuticeps]